MFQTEIHHFLQSFESPFLTSFMRFITALGYTEFFIIFLVCLLFAIDYKKGFVMFQVLMWTAVITFLCKNAFAYPRPFHVDNTIQFLDGKLPDANSFEFAKRGATSFFSLLDKDVLEITRKAEHMEYGFPSGHTSIAIAFWGVLMCLFNKRWLSIICVSMMVLIPFSRMYLGVHFLADVLGGLAIGAFIWWFVDRLILKKAYFQYFMDKNHFAFSMNVFTYFLLGAPLLLLLILPSNVYKLSGFMLGVNLGFLLLGNTLLPNSEGTTSDRILRTILAFGVLAIVGLILTMLFKQINIGNGDLVETFISFVVALVLLWIVPLIAFRFNWFKKETIA